MVRPDARPDASAPDWLVADDRGFSVALHVQPGAKKTEVVGLHAAALKVRVAAPPADGRANGELIRFLAEALGVPKRCVSLVRGASARDKVVQVSGVDPERARRVLAPAEPPAD